MTTNEIMHLRAENERLEKEVEWLANVLKQGYHSDMDDDDCSTCLATLGSISCPCPREDCRHIQAKDWREAARKAVARGE